MLKSLLPFFQRQARAADVDAPPVRTDSGHLSFGGAGGDGGAATPLSPTRSPGTPFASPPTSPQRPPAAAADGSPSPSRVSSSVAGSMPAGLDTLEREPASPLGGAAAAAAARRASSDGAAVLPARHRLAGGARDGAGDGAADAAEAAAGNSNGDGQPSAAAAAGSGAAAEAAGGGVATREIAVAEAEASARAADSDSDAAESEADGWHGSSCHEVVSSEEGDSGPAGGNGDAAAAAPATALSGGNLAPLLAVALEEGEAATPEPSGGADELPAAAALAAGDEDVPSHLEDALGRRVELDTAAALGSAEFANSDLVRVPDQFRIASTPASPL